MSSGTLSNAGRTSALKAARELRGFSREGLAAEAGISPRTIYNIEVDGTWPHRATRRVLALALGMNEAVVFPTTSEGPVSSGTLAKPGSGAADHGSEY